MPSHNKNVFTNIDPKCLKHSAQPPSALSSTILDYYHNYGRNRDLEKYLRFRNRSSSGSSIHFSPTDECRIGKSLENLNILESCLEPEKSAQKSKSNESLNKCGHLKSQGTMEKVKSEEDALYDNQVKLTSKKTVKSKKKYNINMDTCIEITLPQQSSQQPQYQQQTLIPFDSPSLHDFSQQKIEFETTETQTERLEFPKTPNRSNLDTSDSIAARPSSVASSAASVSNKQMEWDSMADVGYIKSTESNNLASLTEFERKALKKFFASHGVDFDDEMVVFASKSKLSNSVPELAKQSAKGRMREKWEIAFHKILEEKYAKRNGKPKQVKVEEKRVWQTALTKFREKYGTHFNPESDLCITDPSVHSTPILPDTSKGAIPKVRNKMLDTKSQTDDIVPQERIQQVEKACQTSFIVLSKECQVDSISDGIIATDYQDISSTRSTDNSKESEKSNDCKEGMISAASFEFFAPGTYHGQDKENIPPWDKEKLFPQRAEDATQNDNKENIPPKDINDDEKVHLSTPAKTTTEASSSRTDELFGAISNLENDLTKGVEILCSLGNANELSEEKKKKLVRKIIRRITKAKYKDSTASSESIISSEPIESDDSKSVKAKSKPNISGVNTLSSSSSSSFHKESSSGKEKKGANKQSNSKENSIKDWLKPITNSERAHEERKGKSKDSNVIEKFIDIENQSQLSKVSSQSDESKIDSNILRFVEKQRQSRLEWIDNEISHLKNVKEFLKNREENVMKDIINLDLNRKKILSTNADKSKRTGVIYENVTVCQGNAKNNYAEVDTSGLSKNGKTTKSNHSINQTAKESFQPPIEKDLTSNTSSSLDWNSHINMQQFVRDRKKLQTPNEDIASYAHAKEQEFIGKYECIRSRPIYTQPYSSDHSEGHYSQPHDNDRKTSSKKNTNDAYTSITGSDGFLSSDSVSIPVANSTSNTTTHQYDTRASVAIQTSNSLTRTAPVFKVKLPSCNCKGMCNCVNVRRPTIRVKTQTNDKQLQVMPKAICYDINFDEKKQKIEMKKQWNDKPLNTENYLHHSDTSSTSSSKDSKEKSEKKFVGNFGGCAKLSLQDHLKAARPEFVSKADERRKCVIELHNLREKRNEQRNRLFLLSSNHSLRNHLKTLNPPSIVTKRIFTTKAMKQQTRNRYNRLPEILFKEEVERQNRIKKSNRIVRDMFNKNLQTRVLKGQTDLSNSVSVAAI